MEEDKYIKLLKWGREQSDGVTSYDIRVKLEELGFPIKIDGQIGEPEFINEIFTNMLGEQMKKVLSYNAYFQLLEHERLEEAREESKKAVKLATWSFILAAVASAVTIILQIIEISK